MLRSNVANLFVELRHKVGRGLQDLTLPSGRFELLAKRLELLLQLRDGKAVAIRLG